MNLVVELQSLLGRSDGGEDRQSVYSRLDVRRRAVFICQHLRHSSDLHVGLDKIHKVNVY